MKLCVVPFVLMLLVVTDAQSNGDLRLVGPYELGDTTYEGLVEVYYNGEWGTVCDDVYGDNIIATGQVMCRQLGYGTVVDFDYGGVTGTGTIWLDDLVCNGGESRIDECTHDPWGSHNCVHSEDINLRCTDSLGPTLRPTNAPTPPTTAMPTPPPTQPTSRPTRAPTSSPTPAPTRMPSPSPTRSPLDSGETHSPTKPPTIANDGDIYLGEGADEAEGRVFIFYNGQWGSICDDNTDKETEGVVICRQLGFAYVAAFDYKVDVTFSGKIWLDSVECEGGEEVLAECSHADWGVHNCGHRDDLFIRCTDDKSENANLPKNNSSAQQHRVSFLFLVCLVFAFVLIAYQ